MRCLNPGWRLLYLALPFTLALLLQESLRRILFHPRHLRECMGSH